FGTLNMPDPLPFRRVYTRPHGRRNFSGSSGIIDSMVAKSEHDNCVKAAVQAGYRIGGSAN
ncbi:hypothetical protein, partial [Burkholderia singularis]|uniref:hypothetical protein n=1 Tax=Burkholderia singularis TaxID=1503053 RepID=UPI001C4570A3